MKKNITINLCGRLFQIDEDAYELLQHYVESLRTSFGKEEGGEEIADDIEERIAELFEELKADGIEAITIEHVKNIITRIGKPEELTVKRRKLRVKPKGISMTLFVRLLKEYATMCVGAWLARNSIAIRKTRCWRVCSLALAYIPIPILSYGDC